MLATAIEIPTATSRKSTRINRWRLKTTPRASFNNHRTSDVLGAVMLSSDRMVMPRLAGHADPPRGRRKIGGRHTSRRHRSDQTSGGERPWSVDWLRQKSG